jgi:putative transposase
LGGSRGRLVSLEDRKMVIELVNEAHAQGARKCKACELLGITLRTLERWEKDGIVDKRKGAEREVANKLTEEEKKMILATVNNSEYRDLPACQIVPRLADKGIYIASESSIYRILRKEKQLAHRGLTSPAKHKRPKPFEADGSNQLWSWDITFLPSQVSGIYFYLYMIIDVFSRKIVGWSINHAQESGHAANLIYQACLDENINQDQLVLHSDNGKPMKGATMLAMLEKLGVVPSFSRPSVSDDNPFSEALFRTVKYHPTFPITEKFETIFDARSWTIKFVEWYNNVHMHSALKFITPAQRHVRDDIEIMRKRHEVYQIAKENNPARWSRGTRNWELPMTVTLNANRKNRYNTNGQKDIEKLAA